MVKILSILGFLAAHMGVTFVTKIFAYGVLGGARGNAASTQPCAGGLVVALYAYATVQAFIALKA